VIRIGNNSQQYTNWELNQECSTNSKTVLAINIILNGHIIIHVKFTTFFISCDIILMFINHFDVLTIQRHISCDIIQRHMASFGTGEFWQQVCLWIFEVLVPSLSKTLFFKSCAGFQALEKLKFLTCVLKLNINLIWFVNLLLIFL
jgi:hypothetical protein